MTEPIQPPQSGTSSGRAQSGAASKLSAAPPKEEEDWRVSAAKAGAPPAAFDPDSGSAEEREEARSVTNDPDADEKEVDLVYLKSGLDNDLTALYEKHPDHPGGEVFVGPDNVDDASKTPMVLEKLNSGDVVEVDKGDFDAYLEAQKEERALSPEERTAAREEKARSGG